MLFGSRFQISVLRMSRADELATNSRSPEKAPHRRDSVYRSQNRTRGHACQHAFPFITEWCKDRRCGRRRPYRQPDLFLSRVHRKVLHNHPPVAVNSQFTNSEIRIWSGTSLRPLRRQKPRPPLCNGIEMTPSAVGFAPNVIAPTGFHGMNTSHCDEPFIPVSSPLCLSP